MTAAASWEAADDKLPSEISALLNASEQPTLSRLNLLAAIPEWQVKLPGGERPSCTDILAITRNDLGLCVIAVEAKVDEDFGPDLTEKRAEPSLGQKQRLDYLHTLLSVAKFSDRIRYQLLHRTASALLAAKDFHAQSAVMMVQSFGSKTSVRSDFDAFCKELGATDLPGGLKVVSRFNEPRLFLGWCDGDKEFLKVDLRSRPH